MASVIITGGCGFIGTWIVKQLLESGHTVTVLDLERNASRWGLILSERQIEQIEQIGFRSVRVDDPEAVKQAFDAVQPDAVIHLAGLQVPTCKANPILGAKVNVIGTLAIFEAAASLYKKPGLCYASSAAIFGSDADYDNRQVGDSSSPKPGTLYGAYKLCNEQCAHVYATDRNLPSVGLRPLTVYGPGRDTGMTSFPTRAIAAAIKGERFDIPFSGPTCYIHAEEVAAFFVAGALQPIQGAASYTMGGEIADTPGFIATLERVVPGAAQRITCSGGALPVASKMDDAALRKAFPQVKAIGLADGIARTAEVFRRLHAEGRLTV